LIPYKFQCLADIEWQGQKAQGHPVGQTGTAFFYVLDRQTGEFPAWKNHSPK